MKALAQGMEEQDGEKVLSAFSEKTIRYLEDGYQMDTRDVERYYNDYIYIMTDENLEDQIDVEMDVLKIEGDWYISFLTTDDLPSL